MAREKQCGGLDYFRVAAAFLVVAIHTSPFASFSADADFIFTRVFARTAVPFFLMVTGYFLLPRYLFGRSMDYRPLFRALKKLLFLYLAAVLLYLPVNLYAGQFKGVTAGGVLRMFLTEGTFYHLWYLPAAISGIVLVFFSGGYGQSRKISFRGLTGLVLVLYGVGLLGDSYYGLTRQIPFLKGIYDIFFRVCSYTRNGFFYAPLFLVLGAGMHERERGANKGKKGDIPKEESRYFITCVIGFVISLALMTAEGMALHRLHFQRHDSMYLMLPAVTVFLFRILLTEKTACRERADIPGKDCAALKANGSPHRGGKDAPEALHMDLSDTSFLYYSGAGRGESAASGKSVCGEFPAPLSCSVYLILCVGCGRREMRRQDSETLPCFVWAGCSV